MYLVSCKRFILADFFFFYVIFFVLDTFFFVLCWHRQPRREHSHFKKKGKENKSWEITSEITGLAWRQNPALSTSNYPLGIIHLELSTLNYPKLNKPSWLLGWWKWQRCIWRHQLKWYFGTTRSILVGAINAACCDTEHVQNEPCRYWIY